MFEFRGIKISWLGHDCFKIKNGHTIYFDPFEIAGGERADVVFITHEHYDHCSPKDLRRIVGDTTVLVATQASGQMLRGLKVKETRIIKPGDELKVGEIEIKVYPAYNINKFRSPGRVYHPREEGKVSYLIDFSGVKIFHAGDTDLIPEMDQIITDIALLPVSGTFVMTPEEAAEATRRIKLQIAIPMHYGSSVGSRRDAEEFKRRAKCDVVILEKER